MSTVLKEKEISVGLEGLADVFICDRALTPVLGMNWTDRVYLGTGLLHDAP